jgi:hypothetical protein
MADTSTAPATTSHSTGLRCLREAFDAVARIAPDLADPNVIASSTAQKYRAEVHEQFKFQVNNDLIAT